MSCLSELSTEARTLMVGIWNVLRRKETDEPVFEVEELAKVLFWLPRGTIYTRLTRLTKKGYVERVRKGTYRLTERGMCVIQELDREVKELVSFP